MKRPRPHTVLLGLLCDLEGAVCARLSDLSGIPLIMLDRTFRLEHMASAAASDLSREQWKKAAAVYCFKSGFRYVLVGSECSRAFGRRALPARRGEKALLCAWYESVEGVQLALLPHPSARNHWYADVANTRRAAKFLREAAKGR